jgi:PiT family inorganic phosphate transporter
VGIVHGEPLLPVTMIAALVFAWTNGFNDAGTAIATSVNTRALTPLRAVAIAAVLNLVGALLGEGLARTIGESLLTLPTSRPGVAAVLAGLVAAIGWNVLMWSRGVPSSSSQALIGGLTGAALVSAAAFDETAMVRLVLVPLLLSPLLGALLAMAGMRLVLRVFRDATHASALRRFRIAQVVSASAMGLGHGLQDGQKTMGVMLLALTAAGRVSAGEGVPWQVQLSVAVALALGTFAGGWRIVRTLGRRIIRVDPVTGFVAESAASSLLYASAYLVNVPISTTHTITAAIAGAGSVNSGAGALRLRVLRPIAGAWVVTLPATAALGAAVAWVLSLL